MISILEQVNLWTEFPATLCSESWRIRKEENVDSKRLPASLEEPVAISTLSDWFSDRPRDSYVTQSISSELPVDGSGTTNELGDKVDELLAGKLGSGIGLPTGLIGESTLWELRFIIEVKTSAIRCIKLAWTVGRRCPISKHVRKMYN